MKKVEKEFQELLFTKTEGRMLEQLTVSSCALQYEIYSILKWNV